MLWSKSAVKIGTFTKNVGYLGSEVITHNTNRMFEWLALVGIESFKIFM